MSKHTSDKTQYTEEEQDQNNTVELYNDDIARKAVGRLFTDGKPKDAEEDFADEEEAEDDSYVTGFYKPKRTPKRTERARAADDFSDEEYDYEDEEDEEYDYEIEERPAARRKRKSTGAKPVVKVNEAAVEEIRAKRKGRPLPSRVEETDEEEEYETFRSRNREDYERPRRRTEESSSRRSTRSGASDRSGYEETYEAEPASPVRWIAAAISFIFILILAILVYRYSVVSGELKELRGQVGNTPSNDSEITTMRLTIEKNEAMLQEKDDEIDRLLEELALLSTGLPLPSGNGSTQTDSPPVSDSSSATSNSGSGSSTTYTVVKGDNLTKISQKFYGNSNLDNIQKIRNANNMSNDNISVGQELKIPE